MSDTTNFAILSHLADEIISSSLTPDLIEKLEDYATKFSQWYISYQRSIESGEPSNNRKDLEVLLEKHERIAEISEKLKELMPQEISKLKQKGKGLMAYTDTLPKKISLTQTKKG